MNAAQAERYYSTVTVLMMAWPRTPRGKLARGFWDMAADHIERVEGKLPSTWRYHGDSLAIWWGQYDRALQLHTHTNNANDGDEDATMPVWIEPPGSKKVKLAAFVVYLRAMRERAAYHSRDTQLPEVHIAAAARADVYALVADQLEAII